MQAHKFRVTLTNAAFHQHVDGYGWKKVSAFADAQQAAENVHPEFLQAIHFVLFGRASKQVRDNRIHASANATAAGCAYSVDVARTDE